MTHLSNGSTAPEIASFWIVCCEETVAAQQLFDSIANWDIPGVRSLIGTHQLVSTDIKQADYAIFATESDRPCSQVKVSPLNHAQAPHLTPLLASMRTRHGRKPQSWLLQLPTEEMRANRLHPVNTQEAVGQALSKIEVFVRNYHLQPQARQAMLQESRV